MKYLFTILIILTFTGCLNKTPELKSIVQTHSAASIRENYNDLLKLLWEYKLKLDKRNPKAYDKLISKSIVEDIDNFSDSIKLYKNDGSPLKKHIDYLSYAFDKNQINNRNDYLIIGIYKMLFDTYKMSSKHKLTALQYDIKKFIKLHKNIQILKWKIKYDKDKNGDFLFLTWQNNWQVELLKKQRALNGDLYDHIKELEYLKNKKETLFDPSNFSYDTILSIMLIHIEKSIHSLGAEPERLSFKALTLFIL